MKRAIVLALTVLTYPFQLLGRIWYLIRTSFVFGMDQMEQFIWRDK